ncbi:hypothetical protein [Oryzifoliimicrobium ureilyticus]|uniref:hypothetical protein n=1 Tax=Oryzifoliimicrobium ureilyticus TaxID=3113724 RepID=UPI003075F688
MAFAADTFNTLWTMRGLLPENRVLDFVSVFGNDPFSRRQIELLVGTRIGIVQSPALPGLKPGISTITLNGYERNFDYWRSQSAARRLASYFDLFAARLEDRDLIYFSAIILAILTFDYQKVLLDAL